MTVAVLLPGPSMLACPPLDNFDIVIGVKRAAATLRCQWAVILDSPDLKRYGDSLLGRPKLLTRGEYRPRYTTLPGLNFEALSDYCPLKCEFTSVAALMLAGLLHASDVRAFGADFGQGATMAEFDGFVSPEANYSASRWERERKQWGDVADFLRERGVTVN